MLRIRMPVDPVNIGQTIPPSTTASAMIGNAGADAVRMAREPRLAALALLTDELSSRDRCGLDAVP
jgi:hypothetical protein